MFSSNNQSTFTGQESIQLSFATFNGYRTWIGQPASVIYLVIVSGAILVLCLFIILSLVTLLKIRSLHESGKGNVYIQSSSEKRLTSGF